MSELLLVFSQQKIKRPCKNKGYYSILMPSEDIEIFEFNQCQKSDNTPSTIYADLESILENIDGCKKNPENSSTTKVTEHIPSGFSMSTISSFKAEKISMKGNKENTQ